jgi:hypothetical protein
MTNLTSEHVAVGKRLFQSAAAAALVMENALPEIYARLRLGRGLLSRKMPDEVKAQTAIEAWAYVSALLVSLVETWSARPRPADLQVIIRALEGALLDAQRINYRPEYEAYRLRLREGRSSLGVPDPTVFGPMYGLHGEFHVRLALAWGVPSRATASPLSPSWAVGRAEHRRDGFTVATSELTQRIESGFRKGLEELWPTGRT